MSSLLKHVFLILFLTFGLVWLVSVAILATRGFLNIASTVTGIPTVGFMLVAVSYTISRKSPRFAVKRERMLSSVALYVVSAILFALPILGFSSIDLSLASLAILAAGTIGVGLSLQRKSNETQPSLKDR